PAYAKSLQKRLDAAAELAEKPDELVRANLQLKTIDEELSKALLEAATALKKEGELLKKKQADEAAKVEGERSLKLFNSKQVDQAREAGAAKKGDKALIKEVQRMVTVAEETAEKGDHVKALSQLRLAQKRVQEIVQDPYGPAIGSRNNLHKDEQV